MLNYEFPPIGGGAGKANLCILNEFAGRDDLCIDLLTSKPGIQDEVEQFAPNIKIHKVAIRKRNLHYWRKSEVFQWLWRAGGVYKKLIKASDYGLVHSFFAFPSGWLCYRSRDRLPYILSLRGSDVPGYNERLGIDYVLLGGLFKRIWSGASAVIANSSGLARLANNFMPALDVGVIYNGIDTGRFYFRGERSPGERVRLLTVCRLIERKRIDILIRAVKKLVDAGVDVQLDVAGEGNLRERLARLGEDLGIGSRVCFLGRLEAEKMPDIYACSDIFVMSSEHEGMSNAMLEAMSAGLPVITTDCEGVSELVDDNGIVVNDMGAGAFARAVQNVIDDHQRYRGMSKSARVRAENFSWQAVAEKYLECYKEAAVEFTGRV
jgi:glycosyltransferase involved in cell wall biosynthesis